MLCSYSENPLQREESCCKIMVTIRFEISESGSLENYKEELSCKLGKALKVQNGKKKLMCVTLSIKTSLFMKETTLS